MGNCQKQFVITIDGPAGSGKSTVARRVADLLEMRFLDTGAMYRAIAVGLLDTVGRTAIDGLVQSDAMASTVDQLAIDYRLKETSGDQPNEHYGVWVNDIEVTHRLRTAEVTEVASCVATSRPVRDRLVALQRAFASQWQQCVTEGRDQGTVVFPAAQLKIYLDASDQVRAERRVAQLQAAGQSVNAEAIEQAMQQRDQADRTRTEAPLRRADDAVVIDTSSMTLDEVVEQIIALVKHRMEAQ